MNISDPSLGGIMLQLYLETNGLFPSLILLPFFIIIMSVFRISNIVYNIDSMNLSFFVCLCLAFILSAVGYGSIILVGVFFAMLLIGLLLSKITRG